jgi:pilus assembly protein CpaC
VWATAFLLAPALANGQAPVLQVVQSKKLQIPSDAVKDKEAQLIDRVVEPELLFKLDPSQSKVVQTKVPVARISITDPNVAEVTEFSPTEFEVIGLRAGETTMTIWFNAEGNTPKSLRYLVQVSSDQGEQYRAEIEYAKLQSRINELFPNSQVQLFPVADKLIVRGQARDSKEAAEIMALIGGQDGGNAQGSGTLGVGGQSIGRLPGAPDLRLTNIINLLHVPGEQQVLLKVRVAELTRDSNRELGVNFNIFKDGFILQSSISTAGNIAAIFDGGDIELFIKAFSTNGYGKILAEPTLVTLSGQPATFIAGGEFAVPTAVGVQGVGAVATQFYGFGTQLSFTPTVIDKDHIRLQVAPRFSSLNDAATVNGIPGLNTRGVNTTVDLREGQWLAIAGLIQDEQGGTRKRIPFIGDIPVLGAAFGDQTKRRNETELVVLVSPELVHPMEPEQAPALLPGMSVNDPTDEAFFLLQHIEGHPDFHFRSTVWASYRQHVKADKWVQKHLYNKASAGYCEPEQQYYISGQHGLTE